MRAFEILDKKGNEVYFIEKDATVHDAVKKLAAEKIGSLMVTENRKLIGIVSERDIINYCATCSSPDHGTKKVQEIMSADVVTGNKDDDLMEIMENMKKHHIRHLPVMSGEEIAGMISMRDVVATLLDETTAENQRLVEYIIGKYPA
ncbi:MAG: CBS domain-containing protein [Chitinispirillaceae bacterium]|nr:CBS domain-containing protein [Chitinispirillaceae bacterium]